MLSSPNLPPELWSETFKGLPSKALISLHATSHQFHQIARPLLFGEFHFHPFHVQEGASSRYSDQLDVDRNTKRLEFWTSPAVAPFVRGCTFSAFCRSRDDPSPVFATFFRLLPNLCNLKEVNCVMVRFDRAAVQALCTLSNLARVQLTGCFCAMSQSEVVDLVLHVKSFRCADIASMSSAGAHRWLDILDKDTLHDLTLPSPPSPSLFREGPIPNFPNLQRLLLGIKAWSEIPLLSNFPAMRYLQVSWCPSYSRDDAQSQQPVVLTQLDTYEGPDEVLLFIDPLTAPRRLNIAPCNPQLLLERFFTVRPVLRAVHQLILSLHYLQLDVLSGCLASLPSLREIRMKVYHPFADYTPIVPGDFHNRQTFFESLATRSPFPATLEKLYVSWVAPAPTPDPHSTLALASAQAAREALSAENNALKCVWLATPEFEYLWIRDTDRPSQFNQTTFYQESKEFMRSPKSVGGRDSRTRLDFVFPDSQDPFVLRYTGA
ncbi:hypothetical protein B0H14DRAFT_3605134 [Mycena olivaceomarginata]|nr:hypothetical protein B0H14DRAFT_3605134 [Mycena olivaceomarginata]